MHGTPGCSGSVLDLQASDCRLDSPAVLCYGIVLLCNVKYPHVPSLDLRICGHLVGERRLVCEISFVREKYQEGHVYGPRAVEVADEWTGLCRQRVNV